MSKKIVYLVNVSRKTATLHLPIGIGHIAKSLMINGFPFEVVDLIPVPFEKREDTFRCFLNSVSDPGIFGFSIIAGNGHIVEVEKYARMVRESNPSHIIVYGGPLPSAVPDLCMENSIVDYVVMGEGEESFPLFLKNLEDENFGEVPGLVYRDKDGILKVNRKQRVKNLDLYAPVPYEYFDMDFYNNYLRRTNRCFEISGSRGCKGACKFCFRFSGPGLTVRSGESIFEEIRLIYEKYSINKFNFTDENFLHQKDDFIHFLNLLKKEGINIKFRGQTRIDEIDDEFCRMLAEMGLISISFGVESTDDLILKKIGKKITLQDIEMKIKLMRSYGIDVYTSVIIGFPWETENSIKAIKTFILRNKLQGHCAVNYLSPLPGTVLYEDAKNMKLINDEWEYIRNMGYLYQDRSINMTLLNTDELGQYYEEIFQLGEPATSKASKEYSGVLIGSSIV